MAFLDSEGSGGRALDYDGVVQPLLAALSRGQQIVALFDAEDRMRHANTAFREVFLGGHGGDLSFPDVLRHAFREGVGPKIDCGDVEAFLAHVATRRRLGPQRAFEVDLVDGRWLWVTETLLDDGWLLMVGTDITALKHSERTLRKAHEDALHASRTDPLTALPNRRRVLDLAEGALLAHVEAGRPLGLALIDIDHFKAINDSLGHEGGDRVLVHFADACRAWLRRDDVVGRFGGEEFLVILPGCDADEAAATVDRLRSQVAGPAGPGAVRIPPYTFSAGVAVASPADDVESLVRRADVALYAAKAAGRDRVRLASPCLVGG